MTDDFGAWLAAQRCEKCGAQAHHRIDGIRLCNVHLGEYEREHPGSRAFALND